MNWLQSPYWTPTPDLRGVLQPTKLNVVGANPTEAENAEGNLQSLISSSLSGVSLWLDPSYYNPRNADKTVNGFITALLNWVVFRNGFYPALATGLDGKLIDPVALAAEYAQEWVFVLQHIQASDAGGPSGKSLWDAWVTIK